MRSKDDVRGDAEPVMVEESRDVVDVVLLSFL
jgi:hypothetical protein